MNIGEKRLNERCFVALSSENIRDTVYDFQRIKTRVVFGGFRFVRDGCFFL